MESNIINVVLEDRVCECCGDNNLECLWAYKHIAKTRTKKWKFSVSNCICKTCGFVFLSPVYTEKILSEYYADSNTYFQVDYSIEKRLLVVCRYASNKAVYLELGAKQKTEIHSLLKHHFSEILTQGIEDTSDCDINEMQSIRNESVDVLTHYFVLEHVPKVRAFLLNCWKALKWGGVMIIEVPDLNKYPHDIAALMLYEHTNHFSIQSLQKICRQIGFEMIEGDDENASRSFGMVAVFRKAHPLNNSVLLDIEAYHTNKNAFVMGVKRANEYLDMLELVRQELVVRINKREKVVVWAANDVCDSLFTDTRLLNNVVLVDSDPRKVDFFENQIVRTPKMASQEIADADAIIICTGQWSNEILEFIKKEFNKEFNPENIRVVDYYFG